MAVAYTMKAEWNNLSGLYQPEFIRVKYSTGIGGSCDNIYTLSSAKNWISDKPLLFEFQICDILFDTINHYDYTISTIDTTTTIVFTEKEESIQTNNKTKPLVIDKSIDLIYKKGNYLNTYLIADITGLPDNATLSLTDAQNNQLYSPFNVNGDYGKTACTAETTNTKIAIPLPAQYNGDLWTDYPAGTYNWKLRYHGDDLYKAKDYPLAIQIVDFNTWEVQNPSIYPNEYISAKIRTYANTIPSVTDLLTTNATYDANTGIITYPNNDINDLSVGEHTQLINNKQLLEYTVKNPIEFYIYGDGINTHYSPSINHRYCNIGCIIKDDCNLAIDAETLQVRINNKIYNGYNDNPNHSIVTNDYSANNTEPLPPNTYMCEASVVVSNNVRYYCNGSFNINTEGCSIALSSLSNNQYEIKYKYDLSTPIANAKVGLINNDNEIIQTSTTNNDGNAFVDISNDGQYRPVALNIYNEHILLGEAYEVKNT